MGEKPTLTHALNLGVVTVPINDPDHVQTVYADLITEIRDPQPRESQSGLPASLPRRRRTERPLAASNADDQRDQSSQCPVRHHR
jgi:hypothetical protein